MPLIFADKRPLVTTHLRSHAFELFLNRCLDLVVSTILIVLLSPLLLAIAVAVKLDSPGPALFRQEREGFLLNRFRILKFRSLHIDAEDRSGIAQVEVGDARVTKVGRILRRTSLDELPQLINIFLGQMSLVGPRPHVPGMWAANHPYTVLVCKRCPDHTSVA
ncbi:sugar transferase [Devosia sp. SD17-2]|uniref:sugar transferase n=1 Tax=Devosia sp. SD17-2 TaxID=2976459 RepID=UPI0023D7C297|nr:sugar transferase [Devosia sp. SD17-2]WEJ34076.1 sugar transferase [Devosia sp. SD17-2]